MIKTKIIFSINGSKFYESNCDLFHDMEIKWNNLSKKAVSTHSLEASEMSTDGVRLDEKRRPQQMRHTYCDSI